MNATARLWRGPARFPGKWLRGQAHTTQARIDRLREQTLLRKQPRIRTSQPLYSPDYSGVYSGIPPSAGAKKQRLHIGL